MSGCVDNRSTEKALKGPGEWGHRFGIRVCRVQNREGTAAEPVVLSNLVSNTLYIHLFILSESSQPTTPLVESHFSRAELFLVIVKLLCLLYRLLRSQSVFRDYSILRIPRWSLGKSRSLWTQASPASPSVVLDPSSPSGPKLFFIITRTLCTKCNHLKHPACKCTETSICGPCEANFSTGHFKYAANKYLDSSRYTHILFWCVNCSNNLHAYMDLACSAIVVARKSVRHLDKSTEEENALWVPQTHLPPMETGHNI